MSWQSLERASGVCVDGGFCACSVGGSVRAFAAGVLPSVRCMSANGSAVASALLPECWTQLWHGELSEQRCRPEQVLSVLPEEELQHDQVDDDIEEIL